MTKVLIVEDDQLMSRMYMRVFTFEGFEAQLAENGQAGLDKLKEFTPDIILADMMMPVMNGEEMLEKLKANPATQGIPVIMLTNLADPQAAEETVAKGALQYIVKSKYSPQEITALVKDVLAKQKPAA
ncbi:MAG TPA: response regulator [Candidatus Saccharimonadales bacterium]|nr:response regulator [Candidatus Saccharimonadales bacterium]